MKIKRINKILIYIFTLITIITLTGCFLLKEAHTHIESSTYYSDSEGHYKVCTTCGEIINKTQHQLTHHEKVDSTCQAIGHEAYDECLICGYSTYQVINKKSHTYNIQNPISSNLRSNATCLSKATYYYVCSCGQKGNTYYEYGDKLDHTLAYVDKKDATCTENGYEAYEYCTKCNYTTYKKIDKIPHDLAHVDKKDATCTEDGYEAYDYCTKCSYTTYQKINKLGHSFGDYSYNNEYKIEASCTHEGCNQKEIKNGFILNGDIDVTSNTFTHLGYTYYVSDYSDKDNNLFELERSSYISNKTPFYDIDYITIKYSVVESNDILSQYQYGFGPLYCLTDSHYIDNPFSFYKDDSNKVTNNIKIDLTNTEDHYFSIYSNNTYLIESIIIEFQIGEYVEEKESFTLTLISTNDIHGSAIDTDDDAGIKKATSQIDEIKKTSKYNLLLDQGDIYQGSSEVYFTEGYIMDDYLMINGYDSTILGNHEWDWGINSINRHISYLKIPTLTNNIYKNGELLEGLTPYKIIERCGVKIGIIGCIGNCESSISASKIVDYDFKTGEELTDIIKANSQTLKSLGCEFIILQVHDNMGNYDISLSQDGYVDLVLEGHSHSKYATKDDYGVYHIQSGGNLDYIYKTTITFTYINNDYQITVNSPYYYKNSDINTLNDSVIMKEVDDYYKENYYEAKANEIIVNNLPYTTSNMLDEYMAEAYYNAKSYLVGTEYENLISSVVLGGGYIKERVYDSLSGKVTYGTLGEYYPFDNDICLCKISGYYLKQRFLSNVKYYHSYTNGINKDSILSNKTYYVIVDSYCLDYAANNLELVTYIYDAKYPRDLLANYLKNKYN